MRMTKQSVVLCAALTAFFGASAMQIQAGGLTDRISEGKSIRIGFANEAPFAYPGNNGEPLGMVNVITIGVLERMGYSEIEPVVTDWGGLIPGLEADRFDIVSGGMNILGSRCENVIFSEPVVKVGDAFIVAAGNPKGIQTYDDIIKSDSVMVTGAGYSNVEQAKAAGVAEANIMQVPGPTEILAALTAGRADAGAGTYFAMQRLAESSNGAVQVTDPNALPEESMNWAGIGFRKDDQEFVDKFNAALKEYLGSPDMMQAVAEYGYDTAALPGDKTTEWVCANR